MPGSHPLESQLLEYLQEQLGNRAPQQLAHVADFNEHPFGDEGPISLFRFSLQNTAAKEPCDAKPQPHFATIGGNEPNYFPAYDLDPDQAYSFHVGTRFMLFMGVQKVADDQEPPTARPAITQLVENVADGAKLEQIELAALFRCEDDYFAVYRLQLSGEPIYCLGADCPPGFYRLTEFPPQMVLRLHLGNVLRDEARQAGTEASE